MNNNKPLRIAVLLCHLFFATVIMLTAQNTSLPVGAIPGEIDVSPMGAATYTIPIEVVPGTQGVQPNLSIVYNSFSGMGLLGMKWGLAGLSAVSRCGQTPYYDGDMTAVQFNSNDRFVIDGNRLLMQSNGNYGKLNVPYATETENFIRVVPSGGTDGKPAYFKAYTDDGTIIEYGNSPDSKQTITTDGILSWQVNKITDANGNYMTFHYKLTNREIRIDSIKYTGNPNSGFSPYAKVVFSYDTIPAGLGRNTAFVSGYGVPQTLLLKSITVFYNNAPVRKYSFNYMHETAQNETTAHLKEIVLSSYSDNGMPQQLNATNITWGTQDISFQTKTVSGFNEGYILTGDFDGDGYSDIVCYSEYGNYFELSLNNNNLGFLETYSFGWTFTKMYAYDLDMDGKDEIILGTQDGDTWTFYCLHFFPYQWCEMGTFEHFEEAYFGRFHSSGAPDVLFLCKNKEYNALGQEMGYRYKFFNALGSKELSFLNPNSDITTYVADINGNGRDDVNLVINNNTSTYEYQLKTLTHKDTLTHIHTVGFPTKWHSVYYGDYNGDGIQDALVFCKPDGYSSHQWLLHIGIGNCEFMHPDPLHVITQLEATAQSGSGQPKPKYPVIIADMNGDGKDEIIQIRDRGVLDFFYLNDFSSDGSCSVSTEQLYYVSPNTIDIKNYRIGDFNGDGKADILVRKEKDGHLRMVYTIGDHQYEYTKEITDGMGKEMKLSYKPQYFRAENQVPAFNRKYFLLVVDSLKVSNGIGADLNFCSFEYGNAAYSLPRRTFLGFRTFSCMNEQNNQKETRTFAFINNRNPKHLLFPTGQSLTRRKNGNEETISSAEFTYVIDSLPNNRYMPRCSVTTSKDFLQNTKVRTLVNSNNQGRLVKKINLTYESTGAPNGNWIHLDTTTYFYKGIFLSSNSYHKKTVLEKSITKEIFRKNSEHLLVDTLTYGYTSEGRLAWERKGNIGGTITTSYDNYSLAGVYKEKTVSATGLSRKETYDFDATRRFTTSITNVLNHYTTIQYDDKTGNKIKETDPNGLITTYKYDVFGNLTKVTYPNGTQTKDTVLWYSNTLLPNATYRVITTTLTTQDVIVYYDLLGREVCRLKEGAYYETQYNNLGQVARTSYPFIDLRETRIWHEYTYDEYGRKLTEKAPYINLSYIYALRKVTVTDSLRNNIQSFKDYDALGRIIQAKDEGGTIYYQYDVITENNKKRHQTKILVPNGGATTIVTDLWGNRLSITDPNAGTIISTYNSFNELKTQTDANSNITSYQYDTLGRVIQKKFTTPPPAVTTQTIDYIYDSASKGKGKLHKIKVDGVETEIFSYDNFSRLYQHQKKIDNTFYTQTHTYNANGQLQTLTYPDGFQVTYNYSPNSGKLSAIRRSDDNSNSLIYSVNLRNKYNQPTKCEYGNDVVTEYEYNPYGLLTRIKTGNKNASIIYQDTIYYEKGIDPGLAYWVDSTILNYRYNYNNRGLMNFRSETTVNYMETFTYDSLDRLTGITAGTIGQVATAQLFSYHNNGNILNNSQLGNYSYLTHGSNKPHAVTEIEQTANEISAHRNDVTYNFFNQPTQITEGKYKLNLYYNANQQRQKAERYIIKNNNYVLENTRIYFNKRYEKEIDSAGVTRHYHYIYADDGAVALHIATRSADSIYYIHTDHLGSYCALTNALKQVRQHNYFDPWGNVPLALHRGNTLPPGGEEPQERPSINFSLTTRGFTGHEHYTYFKIINMNGRLYDPVIARFFSPDKYVANSSFTQDFNRYTYARNNPLLYTDPTGDCWFLPLIAIGVSAIVAATSYTIQVAASPGGFQNWSWDAFGANMMMGIGTGLITSGIGGAFGAVGSVTGGLGVLNEFGRAGAHAIVGGMFSYANGGSFWSGAATSFASSLVGSATSGLPVWAQIGASTITGGATSKLTGGTFWQGAVNGFMVSALNHAADAIAEDVALKKYAEAMFPGRVREGAKVKFNLTNGDQGATTLQQYRGSTSVLKVSIPRKFWYSNDNRLLIDCIDHELVHVDDYASGRAYDYATYGVNAQENIMEYKAYSENQWYNQNMREPALRIDYTKEVNYYKSRLPYGWWNVKGH